MHLPLKAAVDIAPPPTVLAPMPGYVPGPQVNVLAPPSAPSQPTRRPPAKSSLSGILAVLAIGGWFLHGHLAQHDVAGDLTLTASNNDYLSAGESCTGEGGYSDITDGAAMTITDGVGKTLATTTLTDGTYDGSSCVFDFDFASVPKADSYTIDLAYSIREGQTYSRSDLADQGWQVHLSLGD